MTREVEAIYQDGVLKPVDPLPLVENQRVKVTVNDTVSAESPSARARELAWLKANAHRYKGQYVALQDDQLVSHGVDGKAVIDEARTKGFPQALFHHVPEDYGESKFELF